MASSADGNNLIAVATSWIYCISTNSGSSWITNTEPQIGSYHGSWYSVAASADGTKYVGINGNAIWVSTNSGITWLSNSVPSAYLFASVALSADGNKLVVVDGKYANSPGLIYTSTNCGITWTQTSAPSNNWASVACSADGTKIVAIASWPGPYVPPGLIYTSTNSGFTWARMNSPNTNLTSVASSADGIKLVLASEPDFNFNVMPYVLLNPGLIYTSTNSGATWVSNNVPDGVWDGVASSADGSRLVAVGQGNAEIYTSTNAGATWISNGVPSQIWYGVASSADGNKLVAVSVFGTGSNPGNILTSYSTPSPQLNLTSSPANLTLAWTVPSTNFVLQQSADLSSWSPVTNPPVLNLTNLQNQVTLSPSNSTGFFRLKTP